MGLWLCYTLFPSNESHVPLFKDKFQQAQYFKSIGIYKESDIQPSLFLSTIDVEIPIDSARYYDMIFFESRGINGSRNEDNFIYFVMGHQQLSEDVTRFIVKLAVMHTYQFNWLIRSSFVKRMHSDRWKADGKPYEYYQDEGLEYGDIISTEVETVKSFDEQYVLCTNVPIGTLETYQGGDGGSSVEGAKGNWQNGVMSAKGFRFMKGYEGFAPRMYYDTGGVATIGYGVTRRGEPDLFEEMISKQPLEEEYTARKSYDLKIQKYGKPIVNFCKQIGLTKQSQFDALCDLSFNAGPGAVYGTEKYTSLPNALKQDPFNEAYIRPIWENYICKDDQGNYLEGLHLRRIAECDIYFQEVYEMRPIGLVDTNGNVVGTMTEKDGNGWLPSDGGGTDIQNAIVESAKKLVGLPYVYGGNYPPLGSSAGTDCSGLCQWAFNDNGKKISRTTFTQINEGIEITGIDNLQPADLIFVNFTSPNEPQHVYMYAGIVDGKRMIVEAPRTGLNIRYIEWNVPSVWRARRLL